MMWVTVFLGFVLIISCLCNKECKRYELSCRKREEELLMKEQKKARLC